MKRARARSRVVFATAACAASLLLAACRGDDARTTITFWAIGSEAERVPELIAAFERDQDWRPAREE